MSKLAETINAIRDYANGGGNDKEIGSQAEEYSMFLEDLTGSLNELKKSMAFNESEFKQLMEQKGIVKADIFDNSNIRFDKYGGLVVLHPKNAKKSKKYREKSHIHLGAAIKALYIDTGHLPQEYYDNFVDASTLRELADYKSKFSSEGAERNIDAAEKAIKEVTQLLKR